MTDVPAKRRTASDPTRATTAAAQTAARPGGRAPSDAAPGSLAAFARRVIVAIALVAAALLLWHVAIVLLLAFAAILLALALRAAGDRITRLTPLSPRLAVAAAIVVLLGVVALVFFFVGATLVAQFDQLSERLPRALESVRAWAAQYPVTRYLLSAVAAGENSAGAAPASWLAHFAVNTVGALGHGLLVLVLAIYLAADPGSYRRGFLALVPRARRGRTATALSAVERALRKWLQGQLIAMLAVGALTGIGLWLLDVPYALSLATIAAVLEFVPYIGPIVAAIPAVLVAFSQSPETALYVTLLYFAVQQIENHALVPVVQRWAVELPPALAVLSVVLFGLLFGLPGVLLAVPLMVVALVLVRELYLDDALYPV